VVKIAVQAVLGKTALTWRILAATAVLFACPSIVMSEPLVFDQADKLMHLHQYDDAIQYLTDQIASRPNDEFLYFLRARAYTQSNHFDKAIADYGNLIALSLKFYGSAKHRDPVEAKELAWRYEHRADLYVDNRQNEKAIADLSKAIQLCPNTRQLYESRADLYAHIGKSELATADATKAKSLPEDHGAWQFNYGAHHVSGTNIPTNERPAWSSRRHEYDDDATESGKGGSQSHGTHGFHGGGERSGSPGHTIDLNTMTYLSSLNNAFAAYRDNSYGDAFMLVNVALRRRPDSLEGRRLRSWISADLGFYKPAIADCDFVLKFAPHDQYARDCKKDSAMMLQKFGPSTQDFDPSWKMWWGELYGCLGRNRTDEAIKISEKHIKENPKNVSGYDILAQAHEAKKQFAEAAVDLSNAIKLDPTYREDLVGRAILYHDLKLFQKSADDYSTVIEMGKISPFHRPTTMTLDELLYRRATDYQSMGQWDKAIADYNDILKMDPDQEEALRYRGDCYFKKKMYDNAVSDYSKSIECDSMSAGSTYLARAKAYEMLNKKDLAALDRKKANQQGFGEKTSRQ
jgi:tetratricopeptide (TPR) repeat protein